MFVEKISTTQCKLSENVRKQKDGEQNHAEREQKDPAVCGEVAKGRRRVQFLRAARPAGSPVETRRGGMAVETDVAVKRPGW